MLGLWSHLCMQYGETCLKPTSWCMCACVKSVHFWICRSKKFISRPRSMLRERVSKICKYKYFNWQRPACNIQYWWTRVLLFHSVWYIIKMHWQHTSDVIFLYCCCFVFCFFWRERVGGSKWDEEEETGLDVLAQIYFSFQKHVKQRSVLLQSRGWQ